MSKQTNWNASAGLITEPSDKEWNEDELVAAEHLNWFFEQVEADLDDLNQLAFMDTSQVGQLKQLIVGSSGLYRGGTDEGGVSFYTAWNAKWTGSDWEEISDTKNDPALLVHDVKDESQLDGISASDVQGWEWTFLRAASVNASNVITWQMAPINVGPFYDITFQDRDNDDNQWSVSEDPSTGHLVINHPELNSDEEFIFKQNGLLESRSPRNVDDGRTIVAQITTDGGSTSGTFDVSNDGNIPNSADELLVYTRTGTDGGTNNIGLVELKRPSHANYVRVSQSDSGTNDSDNNIFWFDLENGQIDYQLEAGILAEFGYWGWRSF